MTLTELDNETAPEIGIYYKVPYIFAKEKRDPGPFTLTQHPDISSYLSFVLLGRSASARQRSTCRVRVLSDHGCSTEICKPRSFM